MTESFPSRNGKHATAAWESTRRSLEPHFYANIDGVSKDEFVNVLYEYYYTTENKLESAILYGPLEWYILFSNVYRCGSLNSCAVVPSCSHARIYLIRMYVM